MNSGFQLEACLDGGLQLSALAHYFIARAINRCFLELGDNHAVPYVYDYVYDVDDDLEP